MKQTTKIYAKEVGNKTQWVGAKEYRKYWTL